jgi:hypothetical protein
VAKEKAIKNMSVANRLNLKQRPVTAVTRLQPRAENKQVRVSTLLYVNGLVIKCLL